MFCLIFRCLWWIWGPGWDSLPRRVSCCFFPSVASSPCTYRVNIFHVSCIIAVIFSRQPPFRVLSHGGNRSDCWFWGLALFLRICEKEAAFVLFYHWPGKASGQGQRWERTLGYSTCISLTFSKTERVWKTAAGSALFPPMWSVWCVSDSLSCSLYQRLSKQTSMCFGRVSLLG